MDIGFWYIVSLSLIEIIGDFNLRWYAQTNIPSYLIYGLLGYAGVIYFLIQSLRYGNVLYVNSMWDGVSGLTGSVASYVLLGDRLETTHQYLGVLSILLGIFLLKKE